jgi:hypothetical protein
MTASTARVTITRTSETDAGQRQVIVSIDDGPKTNLMFGDAVTLEVSPGAHVLKANNTLVWKKVPFEAAPGEQIEFAIANRAGKLALAMLSLVGVGPMYMTIERKRPATV